ncbi:ATP-binding cassette domain-containing protein [Edwardsiella piscicida]|uniref:ABC transporter ATP-binding protein n=3 Tax=Edwardsiella TaxID=635 RepID=A0A0H3DR87_EDWTF|nr:ATP-binding cassette domain-containing protein [Edwardsiella piscicida]ACY83771.1 ABC transporter ATP-binding protein [Edwardsiella tarda EIB202]ADM40981.1 ABC transporter ATP-binding protein [Edwardsiella tarda FL6-60]AGH73015.1 ABC transporter ATP-binding protein [Edwardsiella piscicida C07-087]ARD17452.1 iron ABC transporter ATP-binding protein [Edwardsiella piscicida]EKS7765405.1 ATP-binding cassette domain-containing protein [Edwardsiella piscicida]
MLHIDALHCAILRGVSLSAAAAGCTAVCGASGSGKTTLLRAVAGHLPYRGSVRVAGRPIDGLPPWRRPCRHLNQRLYLFPFLSVEQNLALAQFAAGRPRCAADRLSLLRELEVDHLAQRYPQQLSGGEQQRVALARALVSAPPLLLLDEPFSSLDWPLRRRLWGCLRRVQRQRAMTLLLVSHEPREVDALADACYQLQAGQLRQLT